jgi:hypothetical protein
VWMRDELRHGPLHRRCTRLAPSIQNVLHDPPESPRSSSVPIPPRMSLTQRGRMRYVVLFPSFSMFSNFYQLRLSKQSLCCMCNSMMKHQQKLNLL